MVYLGINDSWFWWGKKPDWNSEGGVDSEEGPCPPPRSKLEGGPRTEGAGVDMGHGRAPDFRTVMLGGAGVVGPTSSFTPAIRRAEHPLPLSLGVLVAGSSYPSPLLALPLTDSLIQTPPVSGDILINDIIMGLTGPAPFPPRPSSEGPWQAPRAWLMGSITTAHGQLLSTGAHPKSAPVLSQKVCV